MESLQQDKQFTMRLRYVKSDNKEVKTVKFVVPKAVFPKLTEKVTKCVVDKEKNNELFKFIEKVGGTVPESYWVYYIHVTDTDVEFSSETRICAYHGFYEHYIKQNPIARLSVKRKWVMNVYEHEEDNESTPSGGDWFSSLSETD